MYRIYEEQLLLFTPLYAFYLMFIDVKMGHFRLYVCPSSSRKGILSVLPFSYSGTQQTVESH